MNIKKYTHDLVSSILSTYEKLTGPFDQIAKSEQYLKTKKEVIKTVDSLKNKNFKNQLKKIVNNISKKIEMDNTSKSINSNEIINKFNLSGFEIAMITIPENLDIGIKFFEYIKQNVGGENKLKTIISEFKNIDNIAVEKIKKILQDNIVVTNKENIELG